MAEQRLHSSLGPIDVLTQLELENTLHRGLDTMIRERYRGVDIMRFPRILIQATSTTVNLGAVGNNEAPAGPSSGDFWVVRRVVIKSNVLTDTARYILFRGSSPSDIQNAYGPVNMLEGFVPPVNQAAISSPAIGASPSTYVNTNSVPVNVTVSGGTVTTIAVNGQTITGVTSGTFTLQPGSYITVTYTVAPTTYTIVNALSSTGLGLNVNVGFYPGTKSIGLEPGEQIYALVTGATVGNIYVLDGEGIRVPAEMKGKIL